MTNDQLRRRVKHFFVISSLGMLAVMIYIHSNRQQGNDESFFFSNSKTEKVEYWTNGNLKYRGYMDGYLKDGTWRYYTEEGELRLKEVYKQGKLISSEEVKPEE